MKRKTHQRIGAFFSHPSPPFGLWKSVVFGVELWETGELFKLMKVAVCSM